MISALGNTTTTAATISATPQDKGTNADFNTFLKMLTAQLKNQDPLNPMEGTEFAVQLATFSGVEQQAQTNKLLAEMVSGTGGATGLIQSSGLIGKQARTTQPVWFGDNALTLDIQPDTRADDVTLVTLSTSGREISRESIGPGAGQIEWYGRDAMGDKLPDGQYAFRIESLRAGEVIADSEAGAYARIIEAEVGTDGIELIFEGGGSALASDIAALRETPS